MFKKVLGSVVVSTVALTGVASTLPTSNIVLANEYDGIGSRDYQEIQGTYLLIHVTGVNEKGEEVFYPKYLEFPLNKGDVLNKKDLAKKVQQTLKAQGDKNYEFVKFTDETDFSLYYENVPAPFKITNEGVKVDEYLKYGNKMRFILSGNVEVKERKIKDTKTQYSSDTNVRQFHEVKFQKRNGETNNLISTGLGKEISNDKVVKVGTNISSDNLYEAAEKEFKTTKEYQEGYRLVKRLNTTIIENARTKREVYNHLFQPTFNYTVSNLREKPTPDGHIDYISETYYISKNGDDFMPEQQETSVEFIDLQGKALNKVNLTVSKANTIKEIEKYIKEKGLETYRSKDGNTYKFSGMIKQNGERYTAIYN
ncbi:hypothetical protein ACFDHY_06685 [Staphylococcus hyicus]|uniref:hypothetical protein n=1 Tax=Staphylococcus hyicus TaxID=1284 RepID=UPI00211C75BC|nr:hypothetical protein [Staphylococcus hyicus]MCQ9299540.1 hypothetical protein [Staphylococcus hyicus]MDP4448303.1 hypothetical protein [Staphylococcus hyicus]MDP4459781.1 hypothetical protein [Staphylococcus hyicus]